ncbi:XopG/HopH/AvrPtoH family type III secretion system effector [Ralstonia pseudosolanacearum]|uniref:XopG/HopH/AvrPtoH family type III secretion system effector n=1 Tax=Ralstonia pseudosolanacearum TaxID=1310165 RepID=UPI001F47C101|nr:type III secretion system effector protein [Ralstonia pseudosolanacearum]
MVDPVFRRPARGNRARVRDTRQNSLAPGLPLGTVHPLIRFGRVTLRLRGPSGRARFLRIPPSNGMCDPLTYAPVQQHLNTPMPIETRYSNLYAQSLVNTREALEDFKQDAHQALDIINSRPAGNQLLSELSELCRARRHKITIHELNSNEEPCSEPVLSRHQIEEYSPENFRENREKACDLAEKRSGWFGKKPGEGASVIVSWSMSHSSMTFSANGSPTGTCPSNTDKVSQLAHELVHAKHMVAGTWKGRWGDDRDPTTSAGKEELRAVGLGKYAETGEPSENAIRAEHGLPLRRKYY